MSRSVTLITATAVALCASVAAAGTSTKSSIVAVAGACPAKPAPCPNNVSGAASVTGKTGAIKISLKGITDGAGMPVNTTNCSPPATTTGCYLAVSSGVALIGSPGVAFDFALPLVVVKGKGATSLTVPSTLFSAAADRAIALTGTTIQPPAVAAGAGCQAVLASTNPVAPGVFVGSPGTDPCNPSGTAVGEAGIIGGH